jgi:hypothetical protein
MADDYEGRAAFTGDRDAALARTGRLLTDAGFQVFPPAGNQLHFENPVSFWKTNKQPLLMVSRGSVTAIGQELVLNAEFGNLRSLMKFLLIVIGAVAVVHTVAISVVLITVNKRPDLLWVSALTILPLPVIFPLVRRIQTWATSRALGALLARAAEGN